MTDTQQVGASPAIITAGECDDSKETNTAYPSHHATTTHHQQHEQNDDDEGNTSAAAYFFGKDLSLATAEMIAASVGLAATADLALDAAADCDAVLDLQESFVSCIEGVSLQHDYDLEQDYTRDYYPNPAAAAAIVNYNTNHSPTSATETTCFLTANEASALILLQTMDEQGKNNNNNNDSSDATSNVIHRPCANPISASSLRDLDILNICSSIDSDEMEPPPTEAAATNVETSATLVPTVSRTCSPVASLSSRNSSPIPPGVLPDSSSSSSMSQNMNASDQLAAGATYDGMSTLCISRADGADEKATGSCHVCSKPTHDHETAQEQQQPHVQGGHQQQQQQQQEFSSSEFPFSHDQLTADMSGCFIL